MLNKIVQFQEKIQKEKIIFDIGNKTDLLHENTYTNNLVWTIENLKLHPEILLTFKTKTDNISALLNIPESHEKIIIRFYLNPEKIINQNELGTPSLNARLRAIRKLIESNYNIVILIKPNLQYDNWKLLYDDFFQKIANELPFLNNTIFFEHELSLYNDCKKNKSLRKEYEDFIDTTFIKNFNKYANKFI